MKNVVGTNDELIEKGTNKLIERGYAVEKAMIDHECFIAKCRTPIGQTVVMEMPICMVVD